VNAPSRVIDDPAALARSARVFRAALARRAARLAREATTADTPRSDAPSTVGGGGA
jgi:hypothetical protein